MSGLNGSDTDGHQTELTIEEREGAIVLHWDDEYIILPPEQAVGLGEILIRYGHHAVTGEEKPGTKTLSDTIIRKIENRVMLVIADLQEKKKQPIHIAQEVVNIVLRESQ
jgi:hypothetical protein